MLIKLPIKIQMHLKYSIQYSVILPALLMSSFSSYSSRSNHSRKTHKHNQRHGMSTDTYLPSLNESNLIEREQCSDMSHYNPQRNWSIYPAYQCNISNITMNTDQIPHEREMICDQVCSSLDQSMQANEYNFEKRKQLIESDRSRSDLFSNLHQDSSKFEISSQIQQQNLYSSMRGTSLGGSVFEYVSRFGQHQSPLFHIIDIPSEQKTGKLLNGQKSVTKTKKVVIEGAKKFTFLNFFTFHPKFYCYFPQQTPSLYNINTINQTLTTIQRLSMLRSNCSQIMSKWISILDLISFNQSFSFFLQHSEQKQLSGLPYLKELLAGNNSPYLQVIEELTERQSNNIGLDLESIVLLLLEKLGNMTEQTCPSRLPSMICGNEYCGSKVQYFGIVYLWFQQTRQQFFSSKICPYCNHPLAIATLPNYYIAKIDYPDRATQFPYLPLSEDYCIEGIVQENCYEPIKTRTFRINEESLFTLVEGQNIVMGYNGAELRNHLLDINWRTRLVLLRRKEYKFREDDLVLNIEKKHVQHVNVQRGFVNFKGGFFE